jgi:23S rRNA pseudouridine1911/1915/1917 synthase
MHFSNQILFEDNHLIIINKLPSQIVQGDKTGDKALNEIVKSFLKDKYDKPGNVFCGVIHRLDRPASGIVVFAKTSKALSRMNQLIKDREIEKTYWAVVQSTPDDIEGRLEDFLLKNEKKNKSYVVSPNKEKAHKAILDYRIIMQSDRYKLLKINLITGRHHQIRVQLSHINCPIKGDVKYDFKRANKDLSIHLHAREILFIHPVSKEKIHITAPPPKEVLWNHFLNE